MLKNTGERLILEQSWNIMTTLEHMHRYKAAASLISNKTVLDAACGTGYGTYHMSRFAKEVYGIDLSEDAIEYAKEHFQNSNLHYQVMSVADLQFADNTFDVITSFETIEHITKELQIEFLNGIKRKLKKNGILIMSTPNDQLLRDWTYGSYYNEFHLCEFEEQEYEQFLKRYFKYVKFFYQTVTEVSAIVRKGIGGESGNMYSMEDSNTQGRYYVAICSDSPISEEWNLESVLLPKLNDYFDEAYYTKQCMLFIDTGDGFTDQNKIISNYVSRDNHTFECNFTLDEIQNIKRIRFDLCEHGGKICIDSATTDKGILCFTPINSSGKEQDFDVFMTLDPQYIAKIQDEHEFTQVTIRGRMDLLPDYVLVNNYEQDCQILKDKSIEYQQQIEEFRKQTEEFRRQTEELRKQAEEFQQCAIHFEKQSSHWKSEHAILLTKVDEQVALIQGYKEKEKYYVEKVKCFDEENASLRAKIENKELCITNLDAERQRLADIIEKVESTKWWRIRTFSVNILNKLLRRSKKTPI